MKLRKIVFRLPVYISIGCSSVGITLFMLFGIIFAKCFLSGELSSCLKYDTSNFFLSKIAPYVQMCTAGCFVFGAFCGRVLPGETNPKESGASDTDFRKELFSFAGILASIITSTLFVCMIIGWILPNVYHTAYSSGIGVQWKIGHGILAAGKYTLEGTLIGGILGSCHEKLTRMFLSNV